ncbi:polyprenyl diphosphate synthase [Picrophilus oshimae]|uniref:Tritrans,polycis-undecaprenyl-diphosphate synthase (geranylgeranyl-diphosphate specific) n=2 Tax=Picrophilus torridus (strain ATCC 700027 / DSM 9790 / JCM 10055 / NBRC 100828 / KAW 2/3) TaxID=1122961 RepID=UPPS_PICTO|nr:polyprenyl diphosphate synthase [Picrophilus oshimae]Q6KZ89.1 RecName: Full=Tritrans,polycis-undecaprenyl-diphosphate synthase (geranylgeranyl-diphosphate specific); AltName: Full=Undecaprenyl diphosphate synthase; Short=UDS; AltName: Full=Undecaprenyl pyrophosphate synthase; Short=UPP synthase [Picrophilus oshimae DSM 9789]AAT43963.1 undecaprenyl pyrophosphate synthetase [Picrophilus oshimae DSM 9789]SMD30965.1 Undecaprenyl pyrophosphate synthetase [Picrophilus oshimae DSM 9789]
MSDIGNFVSRIYESKLLEEIKKHPVPGHLGIITDGNRRYARSIGISENEGHVKGKEKLEEVLNWSMEVGIHMVTVYAFSTENFKRKSDEVNFLFNLINDAFIDLLNDERVYKNGIRVKVIGDISKLPDYLKETIKRVEGETNKFKNFRFNLAIGYGGRQEIIDAIKKIGQDILNGKIKVDNINEEMFRSYLYDKTLPDPDLILRTSGEERISNFLLWQSAYSELYFADVNWPELRKIDFLRAIYSYQNRKRRFGE